MFLKCSLVVSRVCRVWFMMSGSKCAVVLLSLWFAVRGVGFLVVLNVWCVTGSGRCKSLLPVSPSLPPDCTHGAIVLFKVPYCGWALTSRVGYRLLRVTRRIGCHSLIRLSEGRHTFSACRSGVLWAIRSPASRVQYQVLARCGRDLGSHEQHGIPFDPAILSPPVVPPPLRWFFVLSDQGCQHVSFFGQVSCQFVPCGFHVRIRCTSLQHGLSPGNKWKVALTSVNSGWLSQCEQHLAKP